MTGSNWFESGAGRALLREERRRIRTTLGSIFGDQFLQLGRWGGQSFRDIARTQRAAIADDRPGEGVEFVTSPDCLGVANDSVDVVLLPHLLETHDDPHGVLREVDRVLRSDGHVVIVGFNPVSLWGLRHLLSRKQFPPGVRRLIPEHRLRDWLRLLNFSIDPSSFQHFQPPIMARRHVSSATGATDRKRGSGFDRVTAPSGGRFIRAARSSWKAARKAWLRYAPFAGAYIVVVRKEMFTVTPIRPVWASRRRLVGGLVNPTTRNVS